MATSYELNVIAAAVIGGANLAGGVGGPLGAIVGCVLLEVIRNGLVLAQVNSYWQQTLVGVIIIAAVLVDRLRLAHGLKKLFRRIAKRPSIHLPEPPTCKDRHKELWRDEQ